MSKTTPITTLLKSSIRGWIGAKGFWLVVVAALLPVALTGAWVASHRADVAVDPLQLGDAEYQEGEAVRLVATLRNAGSSQVGAFNATLAVGTVSGGQLFPSAAQDLAVEGLAPGETREIALDWNATPGALFVLVTADVEDAIPEIEEFNNQNATPILVRRVANLSQAPAAPRTLAGDANATTTIDLSVGNFQGPLTGLAPQANATFTMDVTNNAIDAATADVVLRVARSFGGLATGIAEQRETVTLAAGETRTITLNWSAREGTYWLEGWAQPQLGASEATPQDNHRADPLLVDANPATAFPAPEERATIKSFYTSLLGVLYLRVVLPLIALFYAAGVIADEKDRGALAYVLTRPIPRFLIPLTKFVGSFLVAAVAVLVGVALTYALMFGTTSQGKDIGFLTTPLLASLVSLFVYGAAFTLLGTIVDRPYLAGLLFVLGWETVATVTGSVFQLASWVKNLTISQHIQDALGGWPVDEGVLWYPTGEGALQSLGIAGAIALGCLVVSAIWMHRREFQVG